MVPYQLVKRTFGPLAALSHSLSLSLSLSLSRYPQPHPPSSIVTIYKHGRFLHITHNPYYNGHCFALFVSPLSLFLLYTLFFGFPLVLLIPLSSIQGFRVVILWIVHHFLAFLPVLVRSRPSAYNWAVVVVAERLRPFMFPSRFDERRLSRTPFAFSKTKGELSFRSPFSKTTREGTDSTFHWFLLSSLLLSLSLAISSLSPTNTLRLVSSSSNSNTLSLESNNLTLGPLSLPSSSAPLFWTQPR